MPTQTKNPPPRKIPLIRKRAIYRRWHDPDGEYSENYLMIHPSGIMLQISFGKDSGWGEQAVVYQSSPGSPIDPGIFIRFKETSTKGEFLTAQRRLHNLSKGDFISLALHKHRKTRGVPQVPKVP